jgi:hypothetical protein
MKIQEIIEKMEAAGCEVREQNGKVWVNSTPNGGKGRYGYLVDGDTGYTGTCRGVTRRQGEIAAILRK